MVEMIQNAYGVFEQLQLSVTGLMIAAGVFLLALLFAVREASSWFFKIDDVKRDVRRLHEVTTQLEGEIKLIQNLLIEIREPLEKGSTPVSAITAVPKKEAAPESSAAPNSTSPRAPDAPSKASGFPIHH